MPDPHSFHQVALKEEEARIRPLESYSDPLPGDPRPTPRKCLQEAENLQGTLKKETGHFRPSGGVWPLLPSLTAAPSSPAEFPAGSGSAHPHWTKEISMTELLTNPAVVVAALTLMGKVVSLAAVVIGGWQAARLVKRSRPQRRN